MTADVFARMLVGSFLKKNTLVTLELRRACDCKTDRNEGTEIMMMSGELSPQEAK